MITLISSHDDAHISLPLYENQVIYANENIFIFRSKNYPCWPSAVRCCGDDVGPANVASWRSMTPAGAVAVAGPHGSCWFWYPSTWPSLLCALYAGYLMGSILFLAIGFWLYR